MQFTRRFILMVGLITSGANAAELSLADINNALVNLPPQSGRFIQTAPNGGQAVGKFYLALPAHLKFAYEAPSTLLVTMRGRWLAVQDAPGAEANRFPVSATPLALLRNLRDQPLTRAHIRAARLNNSSGNNLLEIDIADPSGDTPGLLTLLFRRANWQIAGWRVRDVQGLVTRVRLTDVVYHESLPNHLFFVQEDERDTD